MALRDLFQPFEKAFTPSDEPLFVPKQRPEAFGAAPFLFPKSQEQREQNNQPLFITK